MELKALLKHGRQTTSSYMIVDLIDPCGRQGLYDEVIMVFANGDLLAPTLHGSKQSLLTSPPGRYITTDGLAVGLR